MELNELVRIVESGQHGVPFDVKFGEEELVKLANERAGALAQNVSVDITPGGVTVEAKTKLAALSMDVQLVGKPVLEDGRLRFDIDQLNLNRRPAPDFMRVQLLNAINEKLDPAQLPVTISNMEMGDGWVKVAGVTK